MQPPEYFREKADEARARASEMTTEDARREWTELPVSKSKMCWLKAQLLSLVKSIRNPNRRSQHLNRCPTKKKSCC